MILFLCKYRQHYVQSVIFFVFFFFLHMKLGEDRVGTRVKLKGREMGGLDKSTFTCMYDFYLFLIKEERKVRKLDQQLRCSLCKQQTSGVEFRSPESSLVLGGHESPPIIPVLRRWRQGIPPEQTRLYQQALSLIERSCLKK